MDLKALREKKITDITEQFDELTPDELRELRALEEAEESPRKTLIEAIDEKLEAIADTTETPAAADAPIEEPGFLSDDYTGPLTVDQAQKRLAKAAHEEAAKAAAAMHDTKPAGAHDTK